MATEIGTRIKRAREKKRWSQQRLADVLEVDRKTVDNWENGRTRPRSSIGALEDALEVDLTGEPPPEAPDAVPATVKAEIRAAYRDDPAKAERIIAVIRQQLEDDARGGDPPTGPGASTPPGGVRRLA